MLAWMFCNLALVSVVLLSAGLGSIDVKNAEADRSRIYLSVVLWSVAGLSAFKFGGAMWFLVVRMVSLFPSCKFCVNLVSEGVGHNGVSHGIR